MQVYAVAAFDESKNCDNLYFKKGVHYWTEYMIDGIEASCKYSQPSDTEWTGSQTVWEPVHSVSGGWEYLQEASIPSIVYSVQ